MTATGEGSSQRLQPPPFGLRLAALICAGIGFYGFLATVALTARLFEQHRGPWAPVFVEPISALMILLAGLLLWLRRRAGVPVLLVGAVLPPLVHRFMGGPVRAPSVLLVAAAFLLAANLKHLR
jgi:hypothetical protein